MGHSLYVNIGILTIVQLNKQQNMVNIRLVPSIQEEYYISYTHDALFLHHYMLILILRYGNKIQQFCSLKVRIILQARKKVIYIDRDYV